MQKCVQANDQVLLSEVLPGNTFWRRLKGLLGRRELALQQGLLLEPCNSVHTLGMKFAIGVLFLSADNRILQLIPSLQPGRLSPIVKGAKKVLELHPERLQQGGLSLGDQLKFEPADSHK